MGNIGNQCVDNTQKFDDQPVSTFRKAMKLYKQPVMIKNEYKFNEGDKTALMNELNNINYVLLDYVNLSWFVFHLYRSITCKAMFNSRIKLQESIKSHKFDLNLTINDKARSSNIHNPNTLKQVNYSKLCERSILNNEGIHEIKIISSCIDSAWKNHGQWKESLFADTQW